jgi:hypothetical protein
MQEVEEQQSYLDRMVAAEMLKLESEKEQTSNYEPNPPPPYQAHYQPRLMLGDTMNQPWQPIQPRLMLGDTVNPPWQSNEPRLMLGGPVAQNCNCGLVEDRVIHELLPRRERSERREYKIGKCLGLVWGGCTLKPYANIGLPSKILETRRCKYILISIEEVDEGWVRG